MTSPQPSEQPRREWEQHAHHRRRSPCCDSEAARYLWVHGFFGDEANRLRSAASQFLAAAQLESMTKAPEYIRAKHALRAALEELGGV